MTSLRPFRSRPARIRPFFPAILSLLLLSADRGAFADPPSPDDYLRFVRSQASARWAGDKAPSTLEEWRTRRAELRERLLESWGGFPAEACPLEPKTFGELKRDGYRVEKVAFQTRPGLWMTANAYVPDSPGKHPAILGVHGHWKGAKQDPVVQARCIGAAKLGFFVLAVDALGAGERGVGKALGEYHGEMVGATLLPVGLPLAGLQVYENMRAVDYLRSRPEVDGDRIGITGASGGGNQTMYAGGFDERFKAAIPVCSVGNYQSYLGIGCCQCEVIPGALRYTEEWGVLGLTAPRALMVVNATLDAVQFSVAEAKKSLAFTLPVFQLYGRSDHLRHGVFASKHDYNQEMREAMYGWMTLHLKGEGDGSPIRETTIKTEDPESLRCYPGQTRPDDWMTLPRFAAAEGKKLVTARKPPSDAAAWREASQKTRKTFVDRVLGGFPQVASTRAKVDAIGNGRVKMIQFEPEPGLALTAKMELGEAEGAPLVVLIDFGGAEKARRGELAEAIRASGSSLVTLDLRATGALAQPGDTIGRAPDHNTAEWGLWIGRPLLGQWAYDVRRLLDTLESLGDRGRRDVTLIGVGPSGLVALAVGAVDERVTRVAALGTLASYITEVPYEGQRLGLMAPGILGEVGDVAHLAALCAPKRVLVAGGRSGGGTSLKLDALREAYLPATQVWDVLGAGNELRLLDEVRPAEVLEALR